MKVKCYPFSKHWSAWSFVWLYLIDYLFLYHFVFNVITICLILSVIQDSQTSPIEENISHELFNGEPAVAKFKVS